MGKKDIERSKTKGEMGFAKNGQQHVGVLKLTRRITGTSTRAGKNDTSNPANPAS